MDSNQIIRIGEVVGGYYKKHLLEIMPNHNNLLDSCLSLVDIIVEKEKANSDLTKEINQVQSFRIRNPEGLINSSGMQKVFGLFPDYKEGVTTLIQNMYQVGEYNSKVLEAILKESTKLDSDKDIEDLYLRKTKALVPKEINALAADSLIEIIKIADDFVNGKGQMKKKLTLVGLKGFLKAQGKGYMSQIIEDTYGLIKKSHDEIPKMINELRTAEKQYLDRFYS